MPARSQLFGVHLSGGCSLSAVRHKTPFMCATLPAKSASAAFPSAFPSGGLGEGEGAGRCMELCEDGLLDSSCRKSTAGDLAGCGADLGAEK